MSQDGGGPHDGPATGSASGSGSDAEVGSVAEEAAKLMGALSGWARDQGSGLGDGVAGFAEQAARAAHQVDEHLATGSAECTYCPICRTVHVLRHTSPEVKTQLATAATALLQAAAELLATTTPEDRSARPGVERIDLDDDPGGWPDDPEGGDL